ncbi:hypothetical protein LSCM4_06955 [Leishmania orientalis]|uniref:Uncharacterized protein n=1 Tax=Leishmania orientalis TaxID=2249476 RepID=A0A836HIF1_9TRYP|nr:hypothetical protein LSCM4_06955 [Leishmania orientalis]
MLWSATRQLRALRAKQQATRTGVEERMAAYEIARHAYETAQRQERELRAMLRAAEVRTAQLLVEFHDAETQLRNAATDLGHTQSLCHALESRIAEHVRCQRSAVLLLVPPTCSPSPSSKPPLLCRTDPYSLLKTPTGEAFTYDLVELSSSLEAGMHSGEEGDDVSETEGRVGTAGAEADRGSDEGDGVDTEANELLTMPSIKSLLTEAVRDVLHGYHYTFLSTCADDCCLCCQDDNETDGVCVGAALSSSGMPAETCVQPNRHSWPCQPATLCLRILQLLQREAVRSGARALSITVAAGCVGFREAGHVCGTGSATTVASAIASSNATAACGWTDLLLPAAARHQQLTVTMEAAPSEEHEETRLPSMTAGVESFRGESASSVRADSWLDVGYMHHDSAVSPPSAPSSAAANETQLRTHVPTLEGVPVGSIEEAAFWLREAGLLATLDTSKAHKHTTGLTSSGATSVGQGDAPAATLPPSTVVLLVGVDSQDAAGKLHKSLVRIVSDPNFDPGRLAGPSPLLTSGGRSRNGDAPACCSPSIFALYMSYALGAIARTAAAKTPMARDAGLWTSYVKGECERATVSCSAELLLLRRAEVAPLTAGEIRSTTHSFSSRCPAEVCAIAAATRAHDPPPPPLDAAWVLWATLLRPVFGGNSKALWLHYTSSGSDDGGSIGSHDPAKGVSCPDGLRCPPIPRDDTAALQLSAIFCRLVRHDAVASEVSPDLARLARFRP